ncbi:hypothetical protein [Natrinema versiforme]|uniref:Uncharacterized protein n=1 Tax=Natrinema versiforme JCM 10478 TaxID=1227496 RepID=L9Y210_9EURY|nr:hypothetical protein [Natrinema versiforme]ELY67726.1 hypothetical protein C489_09206 [Natrinema versiforme JCM 10478]
MRLRTSDGDRSTSVAADPPAASSSSRRFAKHLLTAAGLLGFTYLVLRVLGPRDDVPVQSVDEVQADVEDAVPDEIQRRAADAVPGDRLDTIRNRTSATVPDDITEISIEGPRSEASETDPDVDPSADADEAEREDADVTGLDGSSDDEMNETEPGPGANDDGDDGLEETETKADYADERADEEITERAEPDVQDTPSEPGEMAVDEDVAEELVDADFDAESDGESDESEE